MIDVVERNFLRLLRSGTFGDSERIEPMSEYKWHTIYAQALMHGVTALVWDGIENNSHDFFMQLSPKQEQLWKNTVQKIEDENAATCQNAAALFKQLNHLQLRPILLRGQGLATLYPKSNHRTSGDIDIYFPYPPQADKADRWAAENGKDIDDSENSRLRYLWHNVSIDNHRTPIQLTNPLLNKRLQDIICKEIRCCDSSYVSIDNVKTEILPPTLGLLLIIVRTAKYLLNEGIWLKQMVDMGMYLRVKGDKVDYVQLQSWIRRLGLQRMARLAATILIHFFHFEPDEMQFIDGKPSEDLSLIETDILRNTTRHNEDWYFTQGKNILVRTNNSGAMLWHIRHSMQYARYYPNESLTNFVSAFIHSLSHIEE